MSRRPLSGLPSQLKDKLIQQTLARRLERTEHVSGPTPRGPNQSVPEAFYSFRHHPGYQQVQLIAKGAKHLGIHDPFFRVHEGVAGATTRINGREYLNFASYNYLGLAGHPAVNDAAKHTIDQYGTSASASRSVSGQRPAHVELEAELARIYGCDGALAFVSGHATNVTVLGHLFGPRDLIIHDELSHNSVLQGIQLSGAKRLSFPHNDLARLEDILRTQRGHYERVLISLEGLYSMDGDVANLPAFIELKRRYKTFLMVDEAHSFGTVGRTGTGVREHYGLAGTDVDIWMGTFSKTLAGCGGFIAGERALIDNLKFLAPGFLYSVGMAPPLAAASLAALQHMQAEPERIERLHTNTHAFLSLARQAGLNTGLSQGIAIVPVITGSSMTAGRLSNALFEEGINVQPIVYPAVAEKAARLRFFVSSEHNVAQIERTVEVTARLMQTV